MDNICKEFDNACEKCNFECSRKLNDKMEQSYYHCGFFLTKYAPLILAFTCTSILLLGLGTFAATSESDLYALWIESNSRLHGERAFADEYFSSVSVLSQFMTASPLEGGDPQVMQLPYLADYYDLHKRYAALTYSDPEFGPQSLEKLCARSIATFKDVFGLFRLYGLEGFPCNKISALDCFKEGDFNFNLPPAVLDKIGFPNVYLTRPSLYNTSLVDNLALASSRQECTMWAGVRYPEGFMFGGVKRLVDSPSYPILGIDSLQTVWDLKTPQQLAEQRCIDKCYSANSCFENMVGKCIDAGFANMGPPTVPGTCWYNASTVYADACTVYLKDPTICPGFMPCVGANCLASTFSPACPAYNGINVTAASKCGSCSPADLVPPSPPGDCADCLKSCGSYSMTTDLLCGTTILNCITAKTLGCIQTCVNIGNDCEDSCSKSCVNNVSDSEVKAAESTLLGFEELFIDTSLEARKNYSFAANIFADRTTDDLVDEAGEAEATLLVWGYVGMIVFAMVSLFTPDTLQSKVMLGVMGMGIVIISVFGGLGLTALVGIPFSPTIIQVLPFLALGLGVQEMFVLAYAYSHRNEFTTAEQIGALMRDAGLRGTLTCLVNVVSFSVGIAIPLPAVSQLSAGAAIVTVVNWFILFTGYVSLIAMNAKRLQADRMDFFCCFHGNYSHKEIVYVPEHITGFPAKLAEFILWTPMKIFWLIFGILVFALGFWGITSIPVGLPLQDIVPKTSYAAGFLAVRDKYYGAYKSGIIVGYSFGQYTSLDFTDKNIQNIMLKMELEMDHITGADPAWPIYETSMWDNFLVWFNSQLRTNQSIGGSDPWSYADMNSLTESPTLELFITASNGSLYTPLCTEGVPCYWINSTRFDELLSIWLYSSDGVKYLEQTSFDTSTNPPKLYSSRIVFVQAGLYTDQIIVNFIKDSRRVTDHQPIPMFPSGFLYDLYEQYVNVNSYLGQQMGYLCITVAFGSYLFLLHPGATLLLLGVVAMITAEVYGYQYFFDLKMNGVCVVNLVFSIGNSVECTAHVIRLFMTLPGTKAERAQISLARMLYPLIFSALSNFLGVLPLLFAKFPYFVLYFFYQFCLIQILGLFNGLIILPILLSYIGPPTLSGFVVKDATATVELPALEEGEEETS